MLSGVVKFTYKNEFMKVKVVPLLMAGAFSIYLQNHSSTHHVICITAESRHRSTRSMSAKSETQQYHQKDVNDNHTQRWSFEVEEKVYVCDFCPGPMVIRLCIVRSYCPVSIS